MASCSVLERAAAPGPVLRQAPWGHLRCWAESIVCVREGFRQPLPSESKDGWFLCKGFSVKSL